MAQDDDLGFKPKAAEDDLGFKPSAPSNAPVATSAPSKPAAPMFPHSFKELLSNIQHPDPEAMKAYAGMGEEQEIREGAPPAAKTMLEMGAGGVGAGLVKGAGALAGAGRALASGAGVAAGSLAGDVASGEKPDVPEALGKGAGVAAFEGVGSALGGLTARANVLARINNLLGVGTKEIRLGATPETLDALASNPARGVVKSGISEKALAKMDPLARNKVVTEARETTGQKLDEVLKAAGDAGKTVNVRKNVTDTLADIPDKRLLKQATTRLNHILTKNGLTMDSLDKLTPTQARTVQRSLDDFADFSSLGEAKSFKDIAAKLRRGISAQTRAAVPESAPLDQHYGDLAGATSATRKAAAKFASEAPESELRKWAKHGLAGVGMGGALYEGYRLLSGDR